MATLAHQPAIVHQRQGGWRLLTLVVVACIGAGLADAPLGAAAIPATVQLTLTPNPTILFAPVELTVVVAGVTAGPLPPGGTVTVASENGGLGGAGQYPLDALGRAVLPLSITTPGDSTLVVSYSGDATYAPGIGFAQAHADFIPTSIQVASSANPSTAGAPVVLTFETDANGGKLPDQATGHMEIAETGGSFQVLTGKNGTITVSDLAPGAHVFSFTFSGSVQAGFAPSATTFTQVVLAASITTVVASPDPAPLGAPIAFTVTVADASGAPVAGHVVLDDGGVAFADLALAGGSASFTTATVLTSGTHTITARYGGDPVTSPSSGVLVETIGVGAAGAAWNLAGNGHIDPATTFLGTTDGAPLVLRTDGVERVRVSPDGNVGIGTAAPSARLTVAGTIASTQGGIRFPDGSVQATAQLTGPAGAQGAPGPQGPAGPAGAPGAPGFAAVHAGSVAVVRAARSHDLVVADPAVKPGSIILLTFVDGFARDENAILVTLHEVHAGSFTAHLLSTRPFDPGRDRLNYLVIDP